jgi:phosphotransferase system HPr (HPr) family protein
MANATIHQTVTVRNPNGLHMRPADMLAKTATAFRCRIEIEREGQAVDCKSILGILTLGAQHGHELILRAHGDDAQEAIAKLSELFDQGFFEADQEIASPAP